MVQILDLQLSFWLGPIGFATLGFLYLASDIRDRPIYILPAAWWLATLWGAALNKRVLFLATYSTALLAGYGFARVIAHLDLALAERIGGKPRLANRIHSSLDIAGPEHSD